MLTTSRRCALTLVLTFALTAGCHDTHHASAADMMSSSTMDPTPPVEPRAATDHPAAWLIHAGGDYVQSAPRVYTIIWPGSEQIGQQSEQFVSWLLTSDYFTTALAEYGVGAGQSMGLIVLPNSAPAKLIDSDFGALVKQLVSNGQVDPQNDANTQVLFVLPPTTIVTDPTGNVSCQQILGYHSSPSSSLPIIAYDVIADCDTSATELDGLTKVMSHEIAEAATDPLPGDGYYDDEPKAQEISDLCNFNESLPIDVPGNTPSRYWVQRQYSNLAAMAGDREPCLPLPWPRPFWGAAIYPRLQTVATATTPRVAQAWMEPFAYGDVGLITWQIFTDDGIVVEPDSGASQAGDTIPLRVTIANPGKAQDYQLIVETQSAKAGASASFAWVDVN